jgi:hypothetical protein
MEILNRQLGLGHLSVPTPPALNITASQARSTARGVIFVTEEITYANRD